MGGTALRGTGGCANPRDSLIRTDVARLLASRDSNNGGLTTTSSEAPPKEPESSGCDGSASFELGSASGAADARENGASAAIVTCVLPPSAYLTMFLWEVMKRSTVHVD